MYLKLISFTKLGLNQKLFCELAHLYDSSGSATFSAPLAPPTTSDLDLGKLSGYLFLINSISCSRTKQRRSNVWPALRALITARNSMVLSVKLVTASPLARPSQSGLLCNNRVSSART